MSDQSKQEREKWLRGSAPAGGDDDFARHAARGRQELASEEEASALLAELDGLLATRFGAAPPLAQTDLGAAAGAEIKTGSKAHQTRVRPLSRWWTAAAAVLLLVAAGLWYTSQGTGPTPEEAYAQAFTPYANELSGRSMGDTPETPERSADLEAALLAYDRRDYAAAATFFADYLNTAPAPAPANATAARLYYGISLLAAGNATTADTILAPLESDPRYGPPARWYRALALLRKGDLPAARLALESIINSAESPFRSRAESLLAIIS
ncbi:hypothetical protein QWY85_07005 [Neolewinella lacunae]|uniref:Tetratricopeptide repeat protein n=1 Tax=Neolewinella lacunae TaxID=1517758 RepID=A0A923PII1_9BACT|nr:hypothetical protein [Neolewinella lacunae]MBC6994778.1 hypothetical protein [Neolewinella lacunae]MDN3634400.1 hypothetical protein [Neolewinella lacunae]